MMCSIEDPKLGVKDAFGSVTYGSGLLCMRIFEFKSLHKKFTWLSFY